MHCKLNYLVYYLNIDMIIIYILNNMYKFNKYETGITFVLNTYI